MKTVKLLIILALVFCNKIHSQKYKDMMNDHSVNFYDVIKEAEAYFKTVDIHAKKSGYKKFRRWYSNNEYKYYPSGNRLSVDHALPEKAYQKYIENNKKSLAKTTNTNGNWREFGPLSIDKISNHYAPGAGRIEDFKVNPNNTNHIYICSRSGGLWKTTDEGKTWQSTATETLIASGVNSIAVDPLDFNHIFIISQNAINNYTHGVYESFDGGGTFKATNFNPEVLGIGGLGSSFTMYTLAMHPTLPNVIFAGTSRGLYKTTDNFNTWTKVISSGNIIQIEPHPTNPQIIYAFNNNNKNTLYTSYNTGGNFVTTIVDNKNETAIIETTKDAPDEVYMVSIGGGILKSTNTGKDFSFVSNQFTTIEDVEADVFVINSNNKNNMVVGSIDAANSIDGGLTFTQRTDWNLGDEFYESEDIAFNYFNSNTYIHADLRASSSINGVFYIATDGCLAKSTDGGVKWTNLMQKNTPGIRENYKLGVSQSNNNIVVCGSQDNGTSIKNDNGWLEAFGADGMEGIIAPINPEYIISSIQYGERIRSVNGGLNVTTVISNDTDGWWESPLAFDPNDQLKIYDFRNGVYVSNDFGLNYNLVGSPNFLKSNPNAYSAQIRNAEIAQNNSNIIIVSRISEIEKSTNGGASFTSIKNNLPDSAIEDIAINPNNDNDIIVVYGTFRNDNKKIYRSNNGGQSWTNITFNLGNIPMHSVVIDHTENPYIYVGSEIGVYYKRLNGTSWTLYNNGLPNVSIEELEINYGANTIKAATWGRGLWEYDLLDRSNFPTIKSTVISTPTTLYTPREGNNQIVTSVIDYKDKLTNVELRYSVNNLLFDNVISMRNTSGNEWQSNTALPTNKAGDKIYFKVFATGSNNDTSSTYKFMYAVKESVFCESIGNDDTGDDYISEFKIGDFKNVSNKKPYTFYDNLEPIVLNLKDTYEVSVKLNATFSLDKAAVWVDFNGDAHFDETELINMSSYTNNVSKGTISFPENTILDKSIRMRVSNIFGNALSPCGPIFGEVEDYVINVSAAALSTTDFKDTESDVSIYPNPSKKYVYVKTDRIITKMELFDISGRKVIYQNNINSKNTKFSMEYLKNSIYLLYIYTNNGTIVKKVVKD